MAQRVRPARREFPESQARRVRRGQHLGQHLTLGASLEHEADPLPVLKGLRRVLAPTAFAVVKVPNYGSLNRIVMGQRWCGFRYPDHLNYFSPDTLRAMAKKAGFETRFGRAD